MPSVSLGGSRNLTDSFSDRLVVASGPAGTLSAASSEALSWLMTRGLELYFKSDDNSCVCNCQNCSCVLASHFCALVSCVVRALHVPLKCAFLIISLLLVSLKLSVAFLMFVLTLSCRFSKQSFKLLGDGLKHLRSIKIDQSSMIVTLSLVLTVG